MGFEKQRRPTISPMGFNSNPRPIIVTSAELLAMFTTPKIIVPAPKAGYANIFLGAMIHKPAGTAYNLTTATGLAVKYTNAAGLAVGESSGAGNFAGFLDQTTVQSRWIRPFTAASGNSAITPVAAAALVLHVLTAEITTGTGGLKVRAFYTVVPTIP
jgi:hypothetical protein